MSLSNAELRLAVAQAAASVAAAAASASGPHKADQIADLAGKVFDTLIARVENAKTSARNP